MSKKKNQKWGAFDSENQLADQINERLKLDKTGNLALLLVCIGEFLLIIFFQYLIEVFMFGWKFNLLHAIIFALIITSVTGYCAYKTRKKINNSNCNL